MPVEGVLSYEEQRALVYAYLCTPHGSKGRFLAERGVSDNQLYRWRARVFAGTLEHGLTPRSEAVRMTETEAVRRLLAENESLRQELAEHQTSHQRELAVRDEELARQRQVVQALGKAIEILHPNGASRTSDHAPNQPERPQGR